VPALRAALSYGPGVVSREGSVDEVEGDAYGVVGFVESGSLVGCHLLRESASLSCGCDDMEVCIDTDGLLKLAAHKSGRSTSADGRRLVFRVQRLHRALEVLSRLVIGDATSVTMVDVGCCRINEVSLVL
jgi:hypothetical protein